MKQNLCSVISSLSFCSFPRDCTCISNQWSCLRFAEFLLLIVDIFIQKDKKYLSLVILSSPNHYLTAFAFSCLILSLDLGRCHLFGWNANNYLGWCRFHDVLKILFDLSTSLYVFWHQLQCVVHNEYVYIIFSLSVSLRLWPSLLSSLTYTCMHVGIQTNISVDIFLAIDGYIRNCASLSETGNKGNNWKSVRERMFTICIW